MSLLIVFKDVSRIRTGDGALGAVAVAANEEFLALKVVMYNGEEVRLPSLACSTATMLRGDAAVRERDICIVVVAQAYS